MKKHLTILLLFACTIGMAQYNHRHQIIAMLLIHKRAFAQRTIATGVSAENLIRKEEGVLLLFPPATFGAYIPPYSLPRGAIFCRMEDAIQRHTKIKVNVGLNGE